MRINEMVDKMTETKKLETILDAKQSNLVIFFINYLNEKIKFSLK